MLQLSPTKLEAAKFIRSKSIPDEPQLLGNDRGDDIDDNEDLDHHDDHDNGRDEAGNAAKPCKTMMSKV